MPEDRPTISSSRITPVDVARHSFGSVRRGFDPQEVRSYLELVSREMRSWEQREHELREELAAAEERARHPVLDEATLTSALGEQSAQVLRRAHEEAARIVAAAESQAASLVHEAQQRAGELQVATESTAAARVAEVELAAAAVHQRAQEEVAAIAEAARAEGDALMARAREHGRTMVDQAQEARRRVLADMAQRRRALTMQIEQFRAARDELAAAVLGVRDAVDGIVADLSRADDRARAAATEVAHRPPHEATEAQLLVEADAAVAALDADAGLASIGLGDGSGTEGPLLEEPGPPADHAVGPAPSPRLATGEAAATATATAEHGSEPADHGQGAPTTAALDTAEVALAADLAAVDDEEATANGAAGPAVEAQSVEELFARLRAGREPGAAAPGGVVTEAVVPPVPAIETPEPPVTAGEGDAPAAGEERLEDAADRSLLERRAALLEPVTAKLARRLKRALQDDQNHLLDRLRATAGQWSEETLGGEEEQRAGYADAAFELLGEAVAAGMTFGFEAVGDPPKKPTSPPDDRAARAAAEALARTVVTLLRRRLTGEGVDAGDDAERVGAAYREWRGERIERLVGDQALSAFSAGVLLAAKAAGGVRWVLGGGADPCADCDDNALSGVLSPGDEFPTGHFHPPAHPGCRCLVTPTPA